MFYYEGSIANALLSLFPNIGLDPSKFRVRGGNNSPLLSLSLFFPPLILMYFFIVWKDVKQRRKFFIDYAKANGFDPLKANDWYSQPKERIMAVKVSFLPLLSSSFSSPSFSSLSIFFLSKNISLGSAGDTLLPPRGHPRGLDQPLP